MKVLLTTLNAKYVHSNLALRYLYDAAAAKGQQTELREFTINNDDDYIYCELMRGDYDLISFSCYVWNVRRILTLAETVKRAKPSLKILLGGPEVSFDAQRIMEENPFVDFIIEGEGEDPLPRLLEELNKKERPDLRYVLNLVYREDGKIHVNPEGPPIGFARVPFPYNNLPCEKDKVVYYESVRGCPFRCSYCLSSIDRGIRALPMVRVKPDLDYFLSRNVMQVKFIDRTFNYDVRRCAEILKYIIEHDNGITNFHMEMCGDLIDEATIGLLERARPGLFQLEIGVQTTNPDTLSAIRRSCNFGMLAHQVKRIREMGTVHLHLDLIAGLPHEDFISFRKSFNDVYALKPHNLQLGFLKLLPGSPLRESAAEFGYVYRPYAPYEVISNDLLSADGLVRLKMIETVLELYYNRGGFEDTVDMAVAALYETPFDFYEELANFYYLKGCQHKSHRKEDLYRILHMFFTWKNRRTGETETLIFELLEGDLKRTMNPDAVKKFVRKGWILE